MAHAPRHAVGPVAGLAVAAALVAGCSTSSNSTPTTTRPTATSATSASTTTSGPSTTTTEALTTTATLPPQTATQGVFYSPSKNISCELDWNGNTGNSAYCFSLVPAQHAVLTPSGQVTTCAGAQCLSNPPLHTPVMPYGTTMRLGPFVCLSATNGVTCVISDGDVGFLISKSGIQDLR